LSAISVPTAFALIIGPQDLEIRTGVGVGGAEDLQTFGSIERGKIRLLAADGLGQSHNIDGTPFGIGETNAQLPTALRLHVCRDLS
jgi:hypothetical protein